MLLPAFRSLLRNPAYLLINLFGFGIGVACAFIALLYAWQEYNVDRHFQNGDRIYRIGCSFMNMGTFANGPEQLIPELMAHCPAVEYGTRFKKYAAETIVVNDQTFREERVLYVDSAFFRIFRYPFVEGSAATAMNSPGQVILSKTLALKYFGNKPAVGQTIKAGREGLRYQVTGVIDAGRDQSHLDGSIWLPVYDKLRNNPRPEWYSAAFYNYVCLRPGATENDLKKELERIVHEQIHPMYAADTPYDQWVGSENGYKWLVQPFRDIYLHSRLNFESNVGGDPDKVLGLLLIGGFILLIAMINYINLVTAQAALRAKEVGIRKTLGVGKAGLIKQFLLESALFGLSASLIGLIASEGFLAAGKFITGSNLIDLSIYRAAQVVGIVVFTLLVSIITGIYPAFFLSGFKPTDVLKGTWSIQGNRTIRSALVVFQFSIAIAMMILVLGIYRQLQVMEQHDWGFDRHGICVIENTNRLGDKAETFRQEISRLSGVTATCIAANLPAGNTMSFKTYKTPSMPVELPLKSFVVDADYLPTMGNQLIMGRNFDKSMPTDTSSVILNESAVKALGLGADPLGAEVNKGAHVIGVVSNFNYESLRKEIGPLTLQYATRGYYVIARVNPASTADFTRMAQSIWQKMETDAPFTYYFLDESLAALSTKESVLGKAVLFFTGLSLFIACMGLMGLVAFTAGQRAKEIGIRKVMGASVFQITVLLVRDFLKLTLIALVIAVPIAWWGLQKWLEGFAIRTPLSWWLILAAGCCAVLIACATASSQSLKAALANPTDSLRNV
jgi:putative ABC transport system permease protein